MNNLARTRRAMPWLIIGLVGLYLVERLVIALSSGHLLFHLDPGEYTPFRAVAPYMDRSTWALFLDPVSRLDFFVVSTAPPHGPSITPSLVVASGLVHFVSHHLGAPLGTLTVRLLSLGISTATLLFWIGALLRSGLGRSLTRRFTLLFLLAPPIFLKLSLIYWGSHELVILAIAASLCALVPWIREPASPRLALVQALCVGVVGGFLSVMHGILVVPAAFVGVWLALRATARARRTGTVLGSLGLGSVLAFLGVVSFLATWWMLVQLPTMQAIGLRPAFLANNDFSTIAAAPLAGSSLWSGMMPGDRFVSWVWIQEGPLWVGIACALALLLEARLRHRRGQTGSVIDEPMVSFLSWYMLFAWIVIGAVPEALSETRYVVTLYPVSFALVAAWSLGPRPRLRLVLPVLLIAIQIPTHAGLAQWGQLDSGLRYDGTQQFYVFDDKDEDTPPWRYTRLGGASRAFTLGLRVMREYQWNNSYWQWHTPAEARALDHESILARYLSDGEGVDLQALDVDEFFEGIGYAYRILLPPPHQSVFEALLSLHPDVAPAARRGYSMLPADLRWGARGRELEPGAQRATENQNLVAPNLQGKAPVAAKGSRCPLGMLFVEGGEFELGEWDPDSYERWMPDYVLQQGRFRLEPFCMARFPFPGREGATWPRDGLDLHILAELERQLAPLGRRSCSVLELTLAAAGPENFRYPQAKEERVVGSCDPRDEEPSPLGSFADCVSPLGFHDFLARASWARVDELSRAALTAQGAHHQEGFSADYLVAGGMERQDTIQAPTNFGIHFHQPTEPAFLDDGIRLCADPGRQDAETQRSYERWLEGFFERRYFKDLLGLTQGR